jgi:UDP-N-acetyl-2-amino-2-deoxyglucuronate dehydrogenase
LNINFALIGAAGYVAPRHLKAIKDTGNELLAATDPHDAVGILDRYFLGAKFFPEIERFDRHLEKLRRGPKENQVHYVSICSPNYLHDAHIRLALRVRAHAICEKPLVINPWNLDALQELEKETGRKVKTVLQLRVHPVLMELKEKLGKETDAPRRDVILTYIAGRGGWYHVSWKGSEERSGGLATNIGIHFFDLLMWLFGKAVRCKVHLNDSKKMAGFLELKQADVRWFLSVDMADLPFPPQPGLKTTYRSIMVNGEELEFTDGFADLHTRVYEKTLAGEGFGIEDARPSIELVHKIRTTKLTDPPSFPHPFLVERRF